MLKQIEECLFRLAPLQDLVDEQLIEGIISLCFVLGYVVEQLISLLLPQVDIEVIVDYFDFNIGLVLDLDKIFDIGMVKEGDVDSFLACPTSPA